MNCRDTESLILAERDGRLAKDRLAALSDHVAVCSTCAALRDNLASASSRYRTALASVKAPDAEDAWRELQPRLTAASSAKRRRPLAPVIWIGTSLAAAAAIAIALVISRPGEKAPSAELAEYHPAPPLHDPSIIAGADFVEAGDPDASTLIFVDKESGWLVVWATDPAAPTSG